jgi:hypothetical protein
LPRAAGEARTIGGSGFQATGYGDRSRHGIREKHLPDRRPIEGLAKNAGEELP